ncbi:MAG TPA: LamG domain-containing protein [Kofleriaceae bacterium]|nr:LamG domain-containing protein [Kofleriaceae bacterium]
MTTSRRWPLACLVTLAACTGPEPVTYGEHTSDVLTLGAEQPLSSAPANVVQHRPAWVFGNGHHLAAWQHGHAFLTTTTLSPDVAGGVASFMTGAALSSSSYMTVGQGTGAFLDLDGNPLTPSFPLGDGQWILSGIEPVTLVGSNGSEFLVVYDDNQPYMRLNATRYAASTALLQEPFPLGIENSRTPAMAFDGTNYLIAFIRDVALTQTDIFAQRVSPTGALVGPEIVVANTTQRDEGHAVSCTPSVCLVTWRFGKTIRASRIAPDGTDLDPGGDVIGAVDGSVRLTTSTWDGTAFVVAWRTNAEIRGARYAPDGTLLESNVLLVAPEIAPPERAVLSSDGNGHIVLAYERIDPVTNVSRVKFRATTSITGTDAGPDAPQPDAAPDAPPDAAPDAPPDAAPDASPDASPDAGTTTQPGFRDATNGGTPGFYLLAPLVDPPTTFPGTFDGSFASRLKITVHDVDCQHLGNVGAAVQTFNSVLVYTSTQQYKVALNISSAIYISGNCYRVIPRLDGAPLGYRDVQALPTGTSFLPLDGYKKWGIGANTTIAFRLENMDPDGDGVLSHVDNCALVANANQADGDGDGAGDVCDSDDDNDGIADVADNCVFVANADQANLDGDALGDVCDPDDDNDGVADTTDNCARVANANQANNDNDALGDACDPDDDNDGVLDATDNCVFVANASQADTDGDGIGDACDTVTACAAVTGRIGAWTGDNTTEDSIGTADGTFTGAALFAPAIVGPAGFAFNGANLLKASSFEYAGTFTLSFWMKPNATQVSGAGVIATSEAAPTPTDLAQTFQIENLSGGSTYQLHISAEPHLDMVFGSVGSTAFHHLAVTYDSISGQVIIYLDGRLVKADTWTGTPTRFLAMKIGANRGEGKRFSGIVDDVHVFSRVLTLAEVASIANARAAGICP